MGAPNAVPSALHVCTAFPVASHTAAFGAQACEPHTPPKHV
jgi:hypothetical protein